MTLRRATPDDVPDLQAFLASRAETSMFLRANLTAHGINEPHHPHGTTFWLWHEAGDLAGVFGATNGGYLMAQAPDLGAQVWASWVQALSGRVMRGITGDEAQVRQALMALALRVGLFSINKAEPLYRLTLSDLDDPGEDLRPAGLEDRDMLTDWYTAYLLQTGLTDDPGRAREEARARAAAATRPGPERLLIEDGVPKACASINAQAADMVQVGGVFVPDEYRNQGLGRRVTAARLIEARSEGAQMAILFANNPAAARAYEAIGFERIGSYRVAVLKQPLFLGKTS